MPKLRRVSDEGITEVCVQHDGKHLTLSLSPSESDPSIPFDQHGWISLMVHWPRAFARRVAEAMFAIDDEALADVGALALPGVEDDPGATTSPSHEDVEPWSPAPGAKSVYIGDSVYASHDGFMLTLYTDNGFGPSNIVHLEPGLLERVVEFRDSALAQLKLEAEARDDAAR
jgi:hypothetical protein